MEIAILADDLTGANDSGVQLAKAGLETSVWLNGESKSEQLPDAVVVDTDSRGLPPHQAKEKIYEVMASVGACQPSTVFKKIDSTLRGNVGAEMEAMIEVWQPEYVFLTPSFPKNKRIVKEGTLYVDGSPIGETEFAENKADPVADSRIRDHLKRQFKGPLIEVTEELWEKEDQEIVAWINEQKRGATPIFICDATNEHTLNRLAAFAKQQSARLLLAGSAGLSSALTFERGREAKKFVIPQRSKDPLLFLVGSMSEVSQKQVANLLKLPQTQGIKINAAKAIHVDEGVRARECERVIVDAQKVLHQGRVPVVYSGAARSEVEAVHDYASQNQVERHAVARRIVSLLAVAGEALIRAQSFQAIVMTGGDTAKALCKKLAIEELRLLDEFETGIPVAQFVGQLENSYAITKAGAFGNEETFVKIHQFFLEG
ncbi:four-carbon acid sugar kinase family protein [Shouchella shacheensis]|uniref:four-carbon acid sugar kinase family protein n=1 Tax=Shouchella shacheensis TaxID=1649580 RepID=UPI0007400A60|nr:four-carbon acid sugar kinase family protein [Shouchella shacheensis]